MTPIRMLPLYGCLPSAARTVLQHHQALGMNTVFYCITEQDILYYWDNIPKIFALAHQLGLKVRPSLWGYAGLFGGEALSATTLHYQLTGQQRYLNGVHLFGPHAWITQSGQAVTNDPFFTIMRLQKLCAELGATEFNYDEIKIQRPGENRSGHIPESWFIKLTEHAHALGLRNTVTLSYTTPADTDLARRLLKTGLINEISVTRYYGPGHYTPTPEAYIGPVIENLKEAISASGHHVRLLGWIQGFDWQPGTNHLMSDYAAALRRHGVQDIGLWAGACVDDTPMRVPVETGAHDDQIRRIFNPGPPADHSQDVFKLGYETALSSTASL